MNNFLIETEDTLLIQKKEEELIKKNKFQDAEISSFDIEETPLENALEALDTYGFLSNKKVIIIKNIEVPADWSGNINNSVKIIFNDNLKIRNYKITETGELPTEFIEYEDETQKNQNTVYDVFNNQGYTNFTVTISLTANTQYYLWVKDEDGNIMSQAFNINKPEF